MSSTLQRGFWLAAGPAVFVAVWLGGEATLPHSEVGAWKVAESAILLGLVAWMAIWWLTEIIPLAATSMLPLVVLPMANVMSAGATASSYFDDMIALFLGGFCLAIAFERCGLHRRVATAVLSRFGAGPRKLVLGFLVTSAILSMWVSNTSTALMLLPVGLTVVAALNTGEVGGPRKSGPFAVALLLAIAWGSSIGGLGTLIGTPPNVYLAGFWAKQYAAEIAAGELPALTFSAWMKLGVPLVVVQVPLAWLLLTRVAVRVPARLEGLDLAKVLQEVRPTSRMTRDEWLVAGVFTLTVIGWLTRAEIDLGGFVVPLTGWGKGIGLTDATLAVAAGLVLFALPSNQDGRDYLLNWEVVHQKVPFDALALFGGGLALAAAFDATGLGKLVGEAFTGMGTGESAVGAGLFILVVLVVVTLISEFASNTASAAMVIPVLAGIALAMGLDSPLPLVLAGCLGASCGFAMPVATPPNAIVFGSGMIPVRRMVVAGLWMNAVAIGTMWLVLMYLIDVVF